MGSCLGHETDTNICPNNSTNNNNNSKIKDSNPHYHHQSLASSCLRGLSTPADDQEHDLISNCNGYVKQDSFIVRIVNFKRKKKARHILRKFWLNKTSRYAKLNNEAKIESNNDVQLQNLDVTNLKHNTGHIQDETYINFITPNGCIPSLSRGGSSIDLEWEHEYTQLTQFEQFYHNHNRKLPNENLSANRLNNRTNIIEAINEKELEPSINSIDSLSLSEIDGNDNESMKVRPQQNHLYNKYDVHRKRRIRRNSSQQSWSHLSTPESLEWDIDEEQQQQLTMEDDNLDDDTLKLLHEIEQLKNRVLCETGDNLFSDNFILNTDISIQYLDEFNDNNDNYQSKSNQFKQNLINNNNNNNNNNNDNFRSPCFQWLDSDNENGNYS